MNTHNRGIDTNLGPLITLDTPVEGADLSQKGFAHKPRELLVVAKSPDHVTAFLVSCRLLQ
jgi:hypothetical protein